jgi:succinoglycan biosynthesis transport protein ExoP
MPDHRNEIVQLRPEGNPLLGSAAAGLGMGSQSLLTSWVDYWVPIRQRLVAIVIAVAALTLLASLYVLHAPKQYESIATIRLDPFGSSAAMDPMHHADEGSSYTDMETEDALVSTEMDDAVSYAVVEDAVQEARLDQDPVISALGRAYRLPGDKSAEAIISAQIRAVQALARVYRPPRTFNIEIHVITVNPETSAKVANALANALINHEFTTRLASLTNSSKWLYKQLEDLRARTESSDRALVAYERANNIINPDDHENLMNERLKQLNSALTDAQSLRMQLEADHLMADSRDMDALLASPEATVLQPLRVNVAAAEARFNSIAAVSGAANPTYRDARQQLDEAKRQLELQATHLRRSIDDKYTESVTRERLVRSALLQAKSEADAYNSRAIEYGILKRDADADKTLYNDLLQRVKEANLSATFRTQDLRVSNPAIPNYSSVYPRYRLTIVLAFLVSLMLSCGVAIVLGMNDRTLTRAEATERLLQLPVLGVLPLMQKTEIAPLLRSGEAPVGESRGSSPYGEAIASLRTSLLFGTERDVRVLSVTSAQPEEGKSTLVANLAAAMAAHRSQVLLVDADLRRPSVHRIFGLPNDAGLSTILRGLSAPDESIHTVGRLSILPAGPSVSNAGELLAGGFSDLLENLRRKFDYILIDTPPLPGMSDSLLISTVVDGVILVARAGKTDRTLVRETINRIRRVRTNLLGIVLNGVTSSMSYYYYAYKKYSYYSSNSERDGSRRESRQEEPYDVSRS